MDIQKEREALIAEIEQFKEDALKMYFIESWSESYKTDPFSYAIDDENKIMWMKAQARQLWDFWQAAKASAVPDGYVLMPKKPTVCMINAVVKDHEGDAFLPYSIYDSFVKSAQEQ